MKIINKNDISIILSGFSGEGIQFMGYHLSYILYKNNLFIKTYNEISSEILSPIKDYSNLSNYIIRGSYKKKISYYKKFNNILLVTNYYSLKKNFKLINKKSLIILDFNKNYNNLLNKDKKLLIKLKKNKIIKFNSLSYINYNLLTKYNISKLSYINYFKNSLLLGLLLNILNISYKYSKKFLLKKFKNKKYYLLNYYLLKYGNNIGNKKINSKIKYKIKNNNYKFNYKLINGNLGIVLGIISSSIKYNIGIFYSSYPITPATSINKYFKKYKKYIKIKIFDAEDEISAICTSIGSSIYGNKYIGITSTSGPGMSLLQESLGFAVVLERPLIVINVQRVGPSTGAPTKLEQSDLMQAIYGRHGEAPIPVIAINNIKNSIKISYYALKISLEYMTPIIILSDIYISNNLSLWKITKYKSLIKNNLKINKKLINYKNKYCIGGLINNLSKHYYIINKRQKKINLIIKKYIKLSYKRFGYKSGNLLVISWGSTYEIIKTSINILIKKKYKIGFLHLIFIYPLPYKKIEYISNKYKKIIIFELNNKQLFYLIKSYCNIKINIYNFNKMMGTPFTIYDIINYIKKLI